MPGDRACGWRGVRPRVRANPCTGPDAIGATPATPPSRVRWGGEPAAPPALGGGTIGAGSPIGPASPWSLLGPGSMAQGPASTSRSGMRVPARTRIDDAPVAGPGSARRSRRQPVARSRPRAPSRDAGSRRASASAAARSWAAGESGNSRAIGRARGRLQPRSWAGFGRQDARIRCDHASVNDLDGPGHTWYHGSYQCCRTEGDRTDPVPDRSASRTGGERPGPPPTSRPTTPPTTANPCSSMTS
jgi:hypothetical protein